MAENKKGSTVKRRNQIIIDIQKKGQVFVDELSKEFQVSEVTIRNDLEQLERKNMLIRARGGAINLESRVRIDHRLTEKGRLNYKEKAAIGKQAAKLIKEGETIIIDSGTTTIEIIKNISHLKELTLISNALNIVNELSNAPNINVIIPGGYLRKNSMSLVGPMAEKNLRNLHVDKVFLGVDGFDTKMGVYTPNIEEAHLNEIMIEAANEVIVVADSSKFKRRSFAYICPVNKIHTVVTDQGIDIEDRKRLEDSGIKVWIA
jgi:DeoR family transcriptional regulator, aga operon transcriptional repressor